MRLRRLVPQEPSSSRVCSQRACESMWRKGWMDGWMDGCRRGGKEVGIEIEIDRDIERDEGGNTIL